MGTSIRHRNECRLLEIHEEDRQVVGPDLPGQLSEALGDVRRRPLVQGPQSEAELEVVHDYSEGTAGRAMAATTVHGRAPGGLLRSMAGGPLRFGAVAPGGGLREVTS